MEVEVNQEKFKTSIQLERLSLVSDLNKKLFPAKEIQNFRPKVRLCKHVRMEYYNFKVFSHF